ncbi:hypothetical protein [Pseudobacteriovorax antillogorgiicola]|uniref:Uncharacterized protein n=1 Tax=Pseudobacteriovorax antillogorgiicola TaxID=1513793 RepID=A0A1Y6BTY4_9BACT|nr:hypothetical protein [Pseudobacteriovorax antillogorgiicola]TCS54573.1 hypothetical protein EDD56_10686 [Pseudobacteriovorax antillogorgiicola]SMF18036.1 hypothetical protein SAMN06296036_106157 [Pseudobacteriovorax antillogorgiicola]
MWKSSLLLLSMASPLFGQGFGQKPFVQPYLKCETIDGKEVCANVSISGATHPGYYFPDVAVCEDVKTQRPFWPLPVDTKTDPKDPRLQDKAFMKELAWVTNQTRSTACTCCHDSSLGTSYAAWDISEPLIWTDQLTERGVAILAGELSSASSGVFKKEDNFGFDRRITGIPSTDPERMKAFFMNEFNRRGITQEMVDSYGDFGGFIFDRARNQVPTLCTPEEEGLLSNGTVAWSGGPARYVYILPALAPNPLVPPNSDTPEGTVWRLNVDHRAPALESGVTYGGIPQGSYQAVPVADQVAPPLVSGQVYRLYVLKDVLFPLTNCFFKAP